MKRLAILMLLAGETAAMELSTETSSWAPIAADHGGEYSATCARWYGDADVFVSSRDRLDGLRVVERRRSQADAQLDGGYLDYDESGGSELIASGTWRRFHVRAGTDQLAESDRSLLVTGGLGYASLPVAAIAFAAGASSERGPVGSVDAWFLLFHAAAERDREVGTMRFGIGLRMPGSTSVASGSLTLDFARSWATDRGTDRFSIATSGAIAAAALAWSPINHLRITGALTAASGAMLPGQRERSTVAASGGLGVGF